MIRLNRWPIFALTVAALAASSLPLRAEEKDAETKLPSKAEDLCVAGGGRYLVLRLRNTAGISVYDATTELLTPISLPDEEFVFGAGGDVAVVFLKKKDELQTYDLKTGKLIKSKEFANKVVITNIVMGHSRGDLAVLRTGARQQPNGLFGPEDQLLAVAELKMTPLKNQQPGQNNMGMQFQQGNQSAFIRANGDLSRGVEWSPNVQHGFTSHSWAEAGAQSMFAQTGQFDGIISPGDDGRLYTGSGAVLDHDPDWSPNTFPQHMGGNPFKRIVTIKDRSLLPAVGGQFYLALSRAGGLTLYQGKNTEPLSPLGEFPGWDPPKEEDQPGAQPGIPGQRFQGGRPGRPGPGGQPGFGPGVPPGVDPPALPPGVLDAGRTPLTLDKRVCFAPALGYILFLPTNNDRIIQRKFDAKTTLDNSGEEYLLIISQPPTRAAAGAAWEYQVKPVVKNGPAKLELARAPGGMTLSPEGKVTWTAPKGVIGRAPVEIKLTDAKNRVTRQTFDVIFD